MNLEGREPVGGSKKTWKNNVKEVLKNWSWKKARLSKKKHGNLSFRQTSLEKGQMT